jgi:hypothetical protein
MNCLSVRGTIAITLLFVHTAALAGCVLLADVNTTKDSHIVDDRETGFNVTMDADGSKIHVDLDTQQAVEKRLLWAATLGTNQGPSASEFDAVASKWLNFQHPECKVGRGRRVSMGSYEYDLSCASGAAPK